MRKTKCNNYNEGLCKVDGKVCENPFIACVYALRDVDSAVAV